MRREVDYLRRYIEGMKDREAVEFLLEAWADKIAVDQLRIGRMMAFIPHLSMRPAIVLDMVWHRRPWIAPYGLIMQRIETITGYYPDILNVQSNMKHVRIALRRSGHPVTVKQHYGLGYSATAPEGWKAPWEAEE